MDKAGRRGRAGRSVETLLEARSADQAQLSPIRRTPLDMAHGPVEPRPCRRATSFFDVASRFASPYEFNPLNVNPLARRGRGDRQFRRGARAVRQHLKLCSSPRPMCYSGQDPRVLPGRRSTLDAVMASACLPQLFPGGGNRRRALLGRRLHGQSAALSAVLRNRHLRTWCSIQINPTERKRGA
jgi:NTE family protein